MVGINNGAGSVGNSDALGAASKAGVSNTVGALARISNFAALPYNASPSTSVALASLQAVQSY